MRPFVEVNLNSKKLNALLDTGARYSYIRADLVVDAIRVPIVPKIIKIGGKEFEFKEQVVIYGEVKDSEGIWYKFSNFFFPVDDLGEESDKRIDIVIGSLILEEWGTKIDNSVSPAKIEFWNLKKGELIELWVNGL